MKGGQIQRAGIGMRHFQPLLEEPGTEGFQDSGYERWWCVSDLQDPTNLGWKGSSVNQ